MSMPEQFPKAGQPKPKAMEGREHDATGKDVGDAHFHEVGWNTTPDAAKADLARLAEAELEMAERQAESFVKSDKALGIQAYEGLLAIYKGQPAAERWAKRLEELKTS